MLGAAKADPGGSKSNGGRGLVRQVSVCSDFESANLIRPTHEGCEFLVDLALFGIESVFYQNLYHLGRSGLNFTRINFTASTIDRNVIALPER